MPLSPEKKTEVAARAVEAYEAARADTSLSGDRQSLAEFYAAQAFTRLSSMPGGYDPLTDAPAAAEDAAVLFVLLWLQGKQPDGDLSFKLAADAWSSAAALSYYKDE